MTVYVFRIAPDKKSLAIWKKKILLPVGVLGANAAAITAKKRQLAELEQSYVIKIRYDIRVIIIGKELKI